MQKFVSLADENQNVVLFGNRGVDAGQRGFSFHWPASVQTEKNDAYIGK